MWLLLFLPLPFIVQTQTLLSIDHRKVDCLEDHLPQEMVLVLKTLGLAKCFKKTRKSPININMAQVTLTSFPPLIFENYKENGTVRETEANNITATIRGYHKWEKRPTISGGPLKGEYKLAEVHWAMRDYMYHGDGILYGHTINNAKYDMELHFIHTLNGLPIERARLLHHGIVIIAAFVSEVALSQMDHVAFQKSYNSNNPEEFYAIPNKTETPFEWVPPEIFLPDDRNVYFTYNGTFVHPPCDGDVLWIILPTAVSMNRYEMIRYLHSTKQGYHTVAEFSQSRYDSSEIEVFFNLPPKVTPTVQALKKSGHREFFGGVGAAFAALVLCVTPVCVVYFYFSRKVEKVDENFNVGFENVNFVDQQV